MADRVREVWVGPDYIRAFVPLYDPITAAGDEFRVIGMKETSVRDTLLMCVQEAREVARVIEEEQVE